MAVTDRRPARRDRPVRETARPTPATGLAEREPLRAAPTRHAARTAIADSASSVKIRAPPAACSTPRQLTPPPRPAANRQTMESSSSVKVETVVTLRQREQVEKRRPNAGAVRPLGRPPELAQQERRIEDVPWRPARPVALHEPHQVQHVERAEAGGLGVGQVDATVPAPRRERLRLDPPPQRCRHVAKGPAESSWCS